MLLAQPTLLLLALVVDLDRSFETKHTLNLIGIGIASFGLLGPLLTSSCILFDVLVVAVVSEALGVDLG